MLLPGYRAENGTGHQPPALNCYESPVSPCSLGTYFPCIYTNMGKGKFANMKAETAANR